MKIPFINKFTAVTLAILMILSLLSCGGRVPAATQGTPPVSNQEKPSETDQDQYPVNGARKIVNTNKKVYVSADVTDTLSAAYYENEPEILLIEINDAVNELLNSLALGTIGRAPVVVEETDTTVTLTMDDGEYCEIDFVKDTILFSDFDAFSAKGYSVNPHDLLGFSYVSSAGESIYFKRESSFFTPGYGLQIDLGERSIPLDIYDGKKYIPLQTFNDLFLSPIGLNVAYNGEDVFVIGGNALSPELQEIYYLDERKPRSKALAEFNYNELCLYFDLYYGLQNEHGFNDGFDYYFESIGLKDVFLELDPVNSFNALNNLTAGYIADLHSAVTGASPYLGEPRPDQSEMTLTPSNDLLAMITASEKYQTKRAEMLGEVQFYQKVGNTAYITFDSFTVGDRTGDYSEETLQIGDTLTIIMLAHAQITQDKEIENVVLDLSCNGGGAVDSAVYVVAWMLGSCELSVYNSITESRATTNYVVDVNMDGVFDENDTITDKNLYCIVSPVSFSCGNLVPALLKASGNVTILGKASSGGGCFVRHACTADGTLFSLSSTKQMSTVKNGSYYSVDKGVEPHITLTKLESFYDRVALTEFINGIK